jgi:hypothetical protein
MKVYVASSWSNTALLDEVHAALRARGFETLDFRAQGRWWVGPADQASEEGNVDPLYGRIDTPEGNAAFEFDLGLMMAADCAFVVHPCGMAVALETGWFAGMGKPIVVWGREVRKPLDITWSIVDTHGALMLGEHLNDAVETLAELVQMHKWSEHGDCEHCLLRREYASEESICHGVPQSECPKCGAEQDDFDGFGVLHCGVCGYCKHPFVDRLSRRLKQIRCWLGIHDWEPRCMGMRRCLDCRRHKRGCS